MPFLFSRAACGTLGLVSLLAACGGSSSIEAPVASAPVVTQIVGGTVSAMTAGLVLQNNGADDLKLMTNGGFAFASVLSAGSNYNVTVRLSPPFQRCTVSNGAGTVGSADVTNVNVTCADTGVLVSTFAGTTAGNLDGPLANARFNAPIAGVFDADGNLLVSDRQNNSLRRISPAGDVTTLAALPGDPEGVTFNQGRIYVVVNSLDTVYEVDPVTGTATDLNLSGLLNQPRGIVGDAAGNLYVSQQGSQHIMKIDANTRAVSVFAGTGGIGTNDGQGTAASFYNPAAMAIDADGNIYVADQNGPTIRKITPGGAVTTVGGRAGQGAGVDGPSATSSLYEPVGVAIGIDGRLYVTENFGHMVRRIDPDGTITTIAGLRSAQGSANGIGANARFSYPTGIAFDAAGDLLVFEWDRFVRKLSRN